MKTLNLVIYYDDKNPELGHVEVMGGDLAQAVSPGVVYTDHREKPDHVATALDLLQLKVAAAMAKAGA